MLTEHLGDRAWIRVCQQAGADPDMTIITTEMYDDELTVSLIKNSAVEFAMHFEDFMEEFGKAWVRYAASGRYCSMLKACGNELEPFIRNLDGMHQAIASTLTSAKIGSFKVKSSGEGWIIIKYHSARVGLERFIVGLMNGLLTYFNLQGSARLLSYDDQTIEVLLKYESSN